MNNFNLLFSDYYKVLTILYDNQVTIGDETYCNFSQEELSKQMGCTRMTISNLLKKLKNENYISFENFRKYKINPEVQKMIKDIKKLQEGVNNG